MAKYKISAPEGTYPYCLIVLTSAEDFIKAVARPRHLSQRMSHRLLQNFIAIYLGQSISVKFKYTLIPASLIVVAAMITSRCNSVHDGPKNGFISRTSRLN